MMLFLNVLESPVPVEGQPVDPYLRKSWGCWKVNKWTVHILNRLYTRYVWSLDQVMEISELCCLSYLFYSSMGDEFLMSQFWGFEVTKPCKQSLFSNVSEALCREDFGMPLESVECHSIGWLSAWQSDQPYSSISKQQVFCVVTFIIFLLTLLISQLLFIFYI